MTGPPPLQTELIAALVESTESRRGVTDQMMWQVPVLSLTAQSFLLTISLGQGAIAGRIFAAALGAIAALAAMQLLLKHRYTEMTYSRILERIESDYDLPPLHSQLSVVNAWAWSGPHIWDRVENGRAKHLKVMRRRLVSVSSPNVWLATLGIFALADVAVAIIVGIGWL